MAVGVVQVGIAEIVAGVASLFGFVPSRSVIAVCVAGDGSLICSVRWDLPERDEISALVDSAAMVASQARGAGATAGIVIGVDAESAPGESTDAVVMVADTLSRSGVSAWEVAQRCGDRWRGDVAGLWQVLPPVPAGLGGDRAVLPSREAVVAQVGPAPDPDLVGVGAAVRAAAPEAAGWAWPNQVAALAAVLTGPGLPDPVTMAAAAAAVTDLGRRDAVLGWLVPSSGLDDIIDPDAVAVCRERLAVPWLPGPPGREDALRAVSVAAAFPDDAPGCVGPLLIAGWLAWATGDGVLAGAAWERVQRVAPEHRLSGLLLTALERGLRPGERLIGPDGRGG